MEHNVEKIPLIIFVCCLLHNICEEREKDIIPNKDDSRESELVEADDNTKSTLYTQSRTEVRRYLTCLV